MQSIESESSIWCMQVDSYSFSNIVHSILCLNLLLLIMNHGDWSESWLSEDVLDWRVPKTWFMDENIGKITGFFKQKIETARQNLQKLNYYLRRGLSEELTAKTVFNLKI